MEICQKHDMPIYEYEDPYAKDVDNTPGVMMTGCFFCYAERCDEI